MRATTIADCTVASKVGNAQFGFNGACPDAGNKS